MFKTIELTDDLNMSDVKDLLMQKNSTFLRGEAEFYNEHNELLFKKSNLIVLPGKVFALEKLFNVKSKLNIPDLKEQYQVAPSNIIPDNKKIKGPEQAKCVCLFAIGKGGSEDTFGSVKKPRFRDTELYDMIPFRYVDIDNDLTVEEKKKYFFRVETTDNRVAYFLKKFDREPVIEIKRLGSNVDADFTNENEDFDVYVEMELKIDITDVREYFDAIDESDRARYNEIGLVYGIQPEGSADDYTDYEELKLFSKLTFNNDALDSVSKELRIVYRVY